MRTANPALNKNTFTNFERSQEHMSIEGSVHKTFLLLLLLTFVAGFTWFNVALFGNYLSPLLLAAIIGGLIVAIITVFKKTLSPVTAPLYAIIEGFILGAISLFFEQAFPGIVFQAVLLTFGTLFVLLMIYQSGLIKVTENFKLGIVAATGAVLLVYLVSFIGSFFGFTIPYIHGNGLTGIIFSAVVVVIAALNLVLDFDFIEQGAQKGAPKYMEWYAGFGLMVTLVWLYLEILRLLAKIRSR